VDAAIGRVVRATDLGQFTVPSGLSGQTSSFVASARLSLPKRMRLEQRMVFGNGFTVTKNETALIFKAAKFDVTTSYLWLTAGAASNLVDRSEWTFSTAKNLGNNWRAQTAWRYDLKSAAASDAGISVSYRNDCMKIDLSLSRKFVSSSNISASTNFGIQVTLEGFGSRTESNANAQKCSDL